MASRRSRNAEDSGAGISAEVPGPGSLVGYREKQADGSVLVRAAHVIAVDPETRVAQLHVLTVVPRTALMPRSQPCMLAIGTEFSDDAEAPDTWGDLEQ